ncbi:hypothetical protein PL11201_700144 [Planktothrix sp. PCC 11201]|uniref:hypothetical protein n=1 Tax=Planktothrix sp. PCC 11201 TaxID=1729650 RepID=UPI000915F49F|nr:hypothetical protein [Planktothrix sp. PCC 11201]SKB15384.1 hypothetical protein PL11201_700144 [Planktothrix sp. PCC 11201]
METQSKPICDTPCRQTLQSRFNPRLTQWNSPVKPKTVDPLEVYFSILKNMILTRETLPLNSLKPARFKARLSYLNLI